MNLYVTTAELKTYLGISGSAQDTVLAMLNKQATAWLNGYLSVSDLALHKVTQEVHDAIGSKIFFKDLHVVRIGEILDDEEAYVQEEAYDLETMQSGTNYILRLEEYLRGGKRKAKIDYVAGWNASGMATIDIVDYTGLTLKTVTVNSIVKTAGTHWTAGTSNEATATSLAAALDTITNIRSFAMGSRVYVVSETPGDDTMTASVSDAVNMTLSNGTLNGTDFPEDIRASVMMLVSSYMQMRKNSRLKSYTIGTKTVSFSNDSEFQAFKQTLSPYVRAGIFAV